jgi:uncharacterized protein YjbJ (UPF0337 family)
MHFPIQTFYPRRKYADRQSKCSRIYGVENIGSQSGTRAPVYALSTHRWRTLTMDWNRVEGSWKQMTGKVKEQWGKLTDDEITRVNGNRERLEGLIQERYGKAKDEVRREVDDWYNRQTW